MDLDDDLLDILFFGVFCLFIWIFLGFFFDFLVGVFGEIG